MPIADLAPSNRRLLEYAMATESPFPTSAEHPAHSASTGPAGSDPLARAGSAAPQTTPRVEWPTESEGTSSAAAPRVRTPESQADDLISRIAQSAHDTIDRLAASAAPHVDRLQEGLSGEALRRRGEQMREAGDEWTESLRDTVRDNPLAAVAVALAIGALIARVTREPA